MRLAGKVAIVTGGAGGMGEAGALLFAHEGAKVAVTDLNEAGAEETARRIRAEGGQAIAVTADITRSDELRRLVERTGAELGRPNVLFNNAGADVEGKRPLVDIPEEAFDRALEINLIGAWLVMKHVIPAMIEAGGGSIVNTASISALKAGNTVGYAAAKAGLVAMTRVAAIECGRHNIRVNAICPGATLTPMAKKVREEQARAGRPLDPSRVNGMSVLGRMADPEDMARMALFLASDEAAFATGVPFVDDGGWIAMPGIERRADGGLALADVW